MRIPLLQARFSHVRSISLGSDVWRQFKWHIRRGGAQCGQDATAPALASRFDHYPAVSRWAGPGDQDQTMAGCEAVCESVDGTCMGSADSATCHKIDDWRFLRRKGSGNSADSEHIVEARLCCGLAVK